MSSLPELQSGAIFASDYRIERLLAKGGMGAVYVAHQVSKRALKLMHPLLTGDESLRRRFESEKRVRLVLAGKGAPLPASPQWPRRSQSRVSQSSSALALGSASRRTPASFLCFG